MLSAYLNKVRCWSAVRAWAHLLDSAAAAELTLGLTRGCSMVATLRDMTYRRRISGHVPGVFSTAHRYSMGLGDPYRR